MSTGALPVPSTEVKRTTERKEEREEREEKEEIEKKKEKRRKRTGCRDREVQMVWTTTTASNPPLPFNSVTT